MRCFGRCPLCAVLEGSLWLLCGYTLHRGKAGSGGTSLEAARPNKDGAWTGCIDSGDEICWDPAPISELVPTGVAHRMDISLESWPETADKVVHGEVVHFPEFHSPGRAEQRQRAAVLCSYHQFFFFSFSLIFKLSPKLLF